MKIKRLFEELSELNYREIYDKARKLYPKLAKIAD